jgi:DeoR family fructose operon transcriptional repressor
MIMDNRLEEMVTLVEQRGFLSVKELSQTFDVSEVTIRRDLQRLHDGQRLLRTYGGATPLASSPAETANAGSYEAESGSATLENFLMEQIDVLLAVSLSPRSDMILLERANRHNVSIVAESLAMAGATSLVAVDNYQAARTLGGWAGAYARDHFEGQARVLDLTYHLNNTRDRSRGFMDGLLETLPAASVTLSLSTQADFQSAFQLTSDAMQVNPDINIIFCINDTVATGAIQACKELDIDPNRLMILTFGLEGDTLKDELVCCRYLKAGLAMFPEIVGPACIEAAVDAFNGVELPAHLVTPHAILTAGTLGDVYEKRDNEWHLKADRLAAKLAIPAGHRRESGGRLPRKIGFVVPFSEHEWYKNLVTAMQQHAESLGIELAIADAAENLKDELVLRKLGIAQEAANLVKPGDVILIDGGQVTTYLAEALAEKTDITVITNAMSVFDALRDRPAITLILTGGLLRHASQTLIGPTVETVFRELRADRLFLAVTGASLDFGLSHTNLAEVTVKQAMLRATREVILLADHTKFEQESVVQIAPIEVVNKLITDNALPASTRLDLTKLGIEYILAKG